MRDVLGVARDAGRLLAAHWPVLLMWFAAGHLARFYAIELAGTVAAYSALGGMLLLPLAVLARLIALVAMFLVLRDGMRELRAIAPLPDDRAERRTSFVNALFAGILPFVAFYSAWGFLKEDAAAYTRVALDLRLELNQVAIGECIPKFEAGEVATCAGVNAGLTGEVDNIGLNVITISLIVIAFAARWAWKKWRDRLPTPLTIVAVYVEALWIFLSVYVISDLLSAFTGWVQTRQAMVWLGDIRGWVNAQIEPLAWAWDGVEWFIGEAGGIILLPIAWLTIAGVIYGQAVTAEPLRLRNERWSGVSQRFARVPSWLRRRGKELASQFVSLFRPIWSALVLMWRAGPVAIASYVFLYTVLLVAEGAVQWAVVRLIGPHGVEDFWAFVNPALIMLITLVIEPIRISLIASAYDGTVGALRRGPSEVPALPAHNSTEK